MLAPRKKLWTTPKEAIFAALDLLDPGPDDVVFELGFGEGEFIQQCAQLAVEEEELIDGKIKIKSSPLIKKIVGVEIEEERVSALREKLEEATACDEYTSDHVQLICGNALEQDYSEGTVFFFYFIPRGIRLILPMLLAIPHPIRVVSFMNPLPEIRPTKVEKVSPTGHPEAQWPLFYYEFDNRPCELNKREFKAHPVPLH